MKACHLHFTHAANCQSVRYYACSDAQTWICRMSIWMHVWKGESWCISNMQSASRLGCHEMLRTSSHVGGFGNHCAILWIGGKLPSFPRFPWRFPSRSVSGCSPSPQSLLAFQAMGIAGTGEPEPILSLLFQLQVESPFQFRQNVSSSLSLSPLTKTFVYWVRVIFMQFMHIYANADPRMT